MSNMINLANQLDHGIIPIFCNESVFTIVVDIYLQRQNQFKYLIHMLWSFHAAKSVYHCIGKYISGTGIYDCLPQTKEVNVKTLKSGSEGTNYASSLIAIPILDHAIDSLKWGVFIKKADTPKYEKKVFWFKKLQKT